MLERVNLVPQLPLAERIRKATLPTTGVLLLLVVLFLGVSDKVLQTRIRTVDRNIALYSRNAEAAATTQAQVAGLSLAVNAKREEIKQLSLTAERLNSLQAKKKHFSRILDAIARALPGSVRCNKVTFQDNGGLIAGTALQYKELPDFIKGLGAHPAFANVTLRDLDRSTEGEKTDFNFTVAFQLR
ncbi:MAG: PilN domain-containing protein [Thermodesulfobacteriota bacterium]